MDYSDYRFLDVRVRNHIAFITLNGPHAGNAFDGAGHREMSRIMRSVQVDDDVRAVVLTGSGQAFSVGPTSERVAVIASGDPASAYRSLAEVREMVYSAIDCDVPVVTAVNGPASGSALTLALMTDVILVERHVTLRDAHVAGSLAAGDGGVLTWPLAMGLVRAKRYLFTGDPLSADEAHRLGLITDVVDSGTSLTRATELAERLAGLPQLALRSTKRALNQWLRTGAVAAFDLSAAFEQLTMMLPDTRSLLDSLGDRSGASRDVHGDAD